MYTTVKIEKIINKRYLPKLCKYMNCDLNDLIISDIFYCKGGKNCIEGLYVWTEDNEYNYMYVEKGSPQKHVKTKDYFDIIYIILSEYVRKLAMNYALRNSLKNKDFRRALFAKELELWGILDKRGERKRCEHIKKILKEHPYVDE